MKIRVTIFLIFYTDSYLCSNIIKNYGWQRFDSELVVIKNHHMK